MVRRLLVCAAILALLAPVLRATDGITIESRVISSETQDRIVRGTMQFTVINATEAAMTDVKLRLAAPLTGSIGGGVLEVGTVAAGATVRPSGEYELEAAFVESKEPISLLVGYKDATGEDRETAVVARWAEQAGGDL